MNKQKLIFILLAIILVSGVLYWAGTHKQDTEQSTTNTDTSSTPAKSDNFSAQFPDIRSEGYYYVQDWKLTSEDKPFSCIEAQQTTPREPGEEQVVQKTINNNIYCIHSSVEGAAGTSYTTYKYMSEKYGQLVAISFTLGEVNCGNYDEPKSSACLTEQVKMRNSLDSTIDQVFTNLKPI
jgi:hypothetical protein